MTIPARTVIAAAEVGRVHPYSEFSGWMVICNDGTVWRVTVSNFEGATWRPMTDNPQDWSYTTRSLPQP